MKTLPNEADVAAAALVPSFALPLTSSLAFDPAYGYSGASATFTRGSDQWYEDDNGVWRKVIGNTPAFSSKGIFLSAPSRNYCTNYNDASATTGTNVSAGVLSIVTDAVALGARYADIAPAGKFFRFVNNTGSQQTVDITGATAGAKTTASIFARATGGTCTLQASNGNGAIPIAPAGTFERFYSENIVTVASTSTMQILVPAGATLEFLLNQFEATHATLEGVLTGPIIVAGASAATLGTTLKFTDSAGRTPATDFTVYAEYESLSEGQQYGAQCYWSLREDANNFYSLGGGSGLGGNQLHKRVAGVTYDSHGKLFNIHRTTPVACHFSQARGMEMFVCGSKPHRPLLQTDALTLSSAAVYSIGQFYGNAFDNLFTGWVRNFRLYTGAQKPQVLRALTQRFPDVEFLGTRGLPVFDKNNPARIWSLRWNATVLQYDAIEYSDDYGDTWIEWKVLASANRANLPTLHMDSHGNFYYARQVVGPEYDGLWRVDGVTKAQTQVIKWGNWNYGTTTLDRNKTAKHNYYPWTWGEDSEGRLFTASYYSTATDGGAIVYVSTDQGLTWVANTTLATTFASSKHIHSLHVDPHTDKVWVSMGDLERGTFWNTGTLAGAFTQVTNRPDGTEATDGPTGLTFTSEAVWAASDTGGAAPFTNWLQKSIAAAAFTTAWSPPQPVNRSPLYYARACGDNEMWVLGYNETSEALRHGCLYKLVKKPGANSPWRIAKAIYHHDLGTDGGGPYLVGHDGNGAIPESSPYIFVQFTRPIGGVNNPYPTDRLVARITRAQTNYDAPQLVRSVFRESSS